ncbi:hypothetical protein N7492_005541 [Penicillium capsulatum]|uniref:Uncharacterized protein n=1 Tax=Penicillium capsulatum TaxID=69766 RepID=A0A9W9IC28_9EURO|nr:hypothetical protein N7492_005541 [Penicillium capsulatum]KAJ6135357.1 hypothetical protein N7512_000517 [Penicillium capsulatum]
MPLIIPKRNKRSHAILPITLATTASLVIALCYLQLIYLVSYVLRPLWSSHRDFPPLRRTIERVEKLIIDLILRIVPFASYRSPAPTGLFHEEPLGHQIGSGAHLYSSRVTLSGVPDNPAAFTPLPNLPQCYPGTAPERTMPKEQEQPVEATRQSPLGHHGSHGSSNFDTVKRASSTRPNISSVVETGPAKTQQFTQSSLSLKQSQEPEDISLASGPPLNPPRPSQISPACSMDGPSDLATILHSVPKMESSTEDDDDELKLDREAKCRSTESYPGKFPVSESMEFSSLATASYAFRERGTTSVRPFSDY